MHISQLRVRNYKSFRDSGDIRLKEGFNVVVGQNSSGKTALAEAASLRFENRPHLSERTKPRPRASVEGSSEALVTFELTPDELWHLLRDQLPRFALAAHEKDEDPSIILRRLSQAIEEGVHVDCRYTPLWYKDDRGLDPGLTGSIVGHFEPDLNRLPPFQAVITGVGPSPLDFIQPSKATQWSPAEPFLGRGLVHCLRDRIYSFKAERLNVGECELTGTRDLKPDASNLPEVLLALQSNTARFQRFNDAVRLILNDIQQVTVSADKERARILVWNVAAATEREDLAIPLAESGTGISQVLAILFVAMAAPWPRVIIVDEPQSFLHPGAVRKLLDVLKTYKHHQYILTTHSPTAISAAAPAVLLRTFRKGPSSKVEVIDLAERERAEFILADLGVRPSDVFGADAILWVEGRTEEVCFPKILADVAGASLRGTVVIGVRDTGGLLGKDAGNAFDIYDRVSRVGGIVPPALGFMFDREARSDRQVAELESRGKGRVRFLSRRMYENYLLDPEAIATVVSPHVSQADGGPKDALVGASATRLVSEWLDNRGGERKYFVPHTAVRRDAQAEEWLRFVNGSRLLADLFSELTTGQLSFRKVEHASQMTDWLLHRRPEAFREIADLVASLLR